MSDDHDPFNNPEDRHPRANQLVPDETFWDGTCEASPFGGDEGANAYDEFRDWRAEYPDENLTECLDGILDGNLDRFTDRLVSKANMEKLADGDETDGLLGLCFPDVLTLDTTIISTALGQLIDEGRIDAEAKPFVRVALKRQLHPVMLDTWEDRADERKQMLEAASKAIEAA